MLRINPEAWRGNAAPNPGKAARNRTSTRHYHGLDLLRSVALLLGVIFHAAMPVLTPEYLGLGQQDVPAEMPAAPILGAFMDWTHIWRMPAFFLLAGFFAQMVLMHKGPIAFLADRTVRILGVLVTFCILFAMLSGGSFFELGHLWFLWFLTLMCLMATVAWYLPLWWMPGLASWLSASLPRLTLLIVPVVGASLLGREGTSAPAPATVFDTRLGPFMYFWVFFLIGQVLWLGRARIDDLARLPVLGSLLFGSTCSFLVLGGLSPNAITFHIVGSATTLMLVFGLIGMTHALLNRPNRIVRFAVRTAYPVYIFHVWPAIALSISLMSLGLGPTTTVVSSSILTILICLCVYMVLVRHTPLDWLFAGYAKSWFKWPWRANGWP
ncbi:MAG: acyltransferase family protein [Pseudohongiellaceae bacterium]